jgi:hypothetical protein
MFFELYLPNFLKPFCNLSSLNQIVSLRFKIIEFMNSIVLKLVITTHTVANVRTLMTGQAWLPIMDA